MADTGKQTTKEFSIVGSSFRPGASNLISRLRQGQSLLLVREPKNKYDQNAVLVVWSNRALGYIPRGLAAKIAPVLDAGKSVICRKARTPNYGVCELAYIPLDENPPTETEEVPNAESDTDAAG